ncbi:MAG: hypothetical protein ACPL7I_10990, partial [Myxococcota bacterium]
TQSACETKEVRFTIGINPSVIVDIWNRFLKSMRCNANLWRFITNNVSDLDGDGIRDDISDCDNCVEVANADQSDWNKNGKGDACEDSDGDGLTDEEEIKKYHTSPSKRDTDGDGLEDKIEVIWRTDPNKWDTDGDCVFDGDEVRFHTDPLKKDTNENGIEDCIELGGVMDNKDCGDNPQGCYICCNIAPVDWKPDMNDDNIPKAIEKPKVGPDSYIMITRFELERKSKRSCGDCGDIKYLRVKGMLYSIIASNVKLDPQNKFPINWGILQGQLHLPSGSQYNALYGEVEDVKVEYLPLCQSGECKLPGYDFKKKIENDMDWQYTSSSSSANNDVNWTTGSINVSPKCVADKKLSYIPKFLLVFIHYTKRFENLLLF